MCRATRCRTCGKTTWAGCGRHVDQIKTNVPAGQWCHGHPQAKPAPEGTWWHRFTGR